MRPFLQKFLQKLKTFCRRFPILVVIVGLLVVFRIFLPYILTQTINWFLQNKVESYTGRIEDFDLSLYRGAYEIQGFELRKKTAPENHPFITFDEMDISLAWRALFQGKLRGDIKLQKPMLNFVDSQDQSKQQYGQNPLDIEKVFSKLVPFSIESVEVREGEASLANLDLKVPLLLKLQEISIDAKNIHNIDKDQKDLPSHIDAKAKLFSAPLHLKGDFNLNKKDPDFDLSFAFENFNLPKANPFLMAYGPVSFNEGSFNFYADAKSSNGKLSGTLKPVFAKIDVVANDQKFISVKHFVLEIVTAVVNLFFRNSENKVAMTKLQLGGTIKDPEINMGGAISYSLKNAFGKPLPIKIEKSNKDEKNAH